MLSILDMNCLSGLRINLYSFKMGLILLFQSFCFIALIEALLTFFDLRNQSIYQFLFP